LVWKLDDAERLARWKTFRKSLDDLDLDEAIGRVAEFWQSAPFSPYYLDPDNTSNWPDPWTLLLENYYCDVAKALGMLYTIKLTVHDPDIELRVYYDERNRVNYNLVWISEGKYVLNMTDGVVLNRQHIPNTFKLKSNYLGSELIKQ